jgi:ribonuclease Z
MIKVIFLGTSFAIPTAERNHTALWLNYKGENILVDCGEGTQRQIRKANLNPCKITRILLTHWHGDHFFGILGLLQTLSLSGYRKKLFIYGPRGIKRRLDAAFREFIPNLEFETEINEVSGRFFENEEFFLEAEEMTHGVRCNAYSFVKKGQTRIRKDRLNSLKGISIDNLKRLKQGKDIIHNGKKHSAKNLTFREDDRKISFIYDTSINPKIAPFAKNSDILICEATFHSDLEREAAEKGHLTARQAGEIAKKSKSKKLILTHISQRYENSLKALLDDAKKAFKNTEIARDFDIFEV